MNYVFFIWVWECVCNACMVVWLCMVHVGQGNFKPKDWPIVMNISLLQTPSFNRRSIKNKFIFLKLKFKMDKTITIFDLLLSTLFYAIVSIPLLVDNCYPNCGVVPSVCTTFIFDLIQFKCLSISINFGRTLSKSGVVIIDANFIVNILS